MAPKKDITPSKKKDKYRIRNWQQYNQSLVNRGRITFWFEEKPIEKWLCCTIVFRADAA